MLHLFQSAELVLAALSAGAAAGATTSASRAVTDAYEGLKSATARAIKGWCSSTQASAATHDDATVEEKIADPDSYRDELIEALKHVEPVYERELFIGATLLRSLLDREAESSSPNSQINIWNS